MEPTAVIATGRIWHKDLLLTGECWRQRKETKILSDPWEAVTTPNAGNQGRRLGLLWLRNLEEEPLGAESQSSGGEEAL